MSRRDLQPHVALPDGWAEAAGVDVASVLGSDTTVERYRDANLADLSRPQDVQALVPLSTVSESVLRRLPRLRVVSVPGTGAWDCVDVAAATRLGVAVCNVRDYAGPAVAEFTIGLMVALSRRILQADRSLRSGRWMPEAFVGEGLCGKTLGLIGCGTIGCRVAAIARAMRMEVQCTTRSGSAPDSISAVPLETLLRSADIVSLHLPLDHETRGLLGRPQIAVMKPGVLLINTARGALIDGNALLEALRNGRMAGAALDVFETEPPEQNLQLSVFPNVILTPHIAAATTDAQRRAVQDCLANIQRLISGSPQNLVNEEVTARWAFPSSC